jgi:hypothetical protein
MHEHNKNLSSIIGTIQDEVPPTGAADKRQDMNNSVGFMDAVTSDPDAVAQQRSAWRPVFYLMFATLAIVATFIVVMGGREGHQADSLHEDRQINLKPDMRVENTASNPVTAMAAAGASGSAVSVVTAGQAEGFSNKEIYERQAVIMQQLQELTAAMADITAGNDKRWLDNQGELKRMQEDFQHKLDRVSATVAGTQEGSGDQSTDVVETVKDASGDNATQSTAGSMPATGGWVVNVASSEHLEPVEKLRDKLGKLGMQAEIQEVAIGGNIRYRLRIPGFSSSTEARKYAHALDGEFGLKGPWISSR